ncbi:hypothetical protein NRP93_001390 [Clostridium botulinum]|nr:hypothetical protein [Clostridium botulinum]
MEQNNITYEEAVKIGIREGIKYIKEQEYYKTTKRYDRRLRNTRLLLKHYRTLNVHNKIANSAVKQVNEGNAVDILDEIDSINDEEQYIQAICRTKIRTMIIIEHMNKAISYYQSICKNEGKNKERRYNIIRYIYMDSHEDIKAPTYEEVAEYFNINVKTVSRDIKSAIEDLSVLFFGIDGIKL